MLMQVQHINRTANYRHGDSGLFESVTDNIGKLFRSCQKEHGRCVSKIYVDMPDGVIAIGWVFEKREQYTDCNETYLLESWVTLHQEEPTRSIEYHYQEL